MRIWSLAFVALLTALLAGSAYAQSSQSRVSTGTITRFTNTTTYTVNTAWANNTAGATYGTFGAACRTPGGSVLIPEISIQVDENPTVKLQGVLWIFDTAVSNAVEDNASFIIPQVDYARVVGSKGGFAFTLTNNQHGSATDSGVTLAGTVYHAKCAAGSTSLYFMVQVVNAYVPTSGEIMTIKLHNVAAD